jgi:hypothetical protein
MKGLVFVVLALVLTLAGAADERSILDEHLTAYARLQEHGIRVVSISNAQMRVHVIFLFMLMIVVVLRICLCMFAVTERLMDSTASTPTIKQRFSPYARRLQVYTASMFFYSTPIVCCLCFSAMSSSV